MSNLVPGALALASLSVLCAGATPSSGQVFSRNEARTAWTVVEGRVSDIKPVQIEGNKSVLGTAGGGYVGYEVGRTVGRGEGRGHGGGRRRRGRGGAREGQGGGRGSGGRGRRGRGRGGRPDRRGARNAPERAADHDRPRSRRNHRHRAGCPRRA